MQGFVISTTYIAIIVKLRKSHNLTRGWDNSNIFYCALSQMWIAMQVVLSYTIHKSPRTWNLEWAWNLKVDFLFDTFASLFPQVLLQLQALVGILKSVLFKFWLSSYSIFIECHKMALASNIFLIYFSIIELESWILRPFFGLTILFSRAILKK